MHNNLCVNVHRVLNIDRGRPTGGDENGCRGWMGRIRLEGFLFRRRGILSEPRDPETEIAKGTYWDEIWGDIFHRGLGIIVRSSRKG